MDQTIEGIAANHLDIETLATRNADSLDFHDVSVWGVRAALEAAYRAGQDAARPAPTGRDILAARSQPRGGNLGGNAVTT